jgi:hypothetical protein
MSTSLLDLPEELLTHILCFLELQDLDHCTRTNKLLLAIIRNTIQIKYNILLQAHGLIDNPSCSMAIAERLERLEAREANWTAFRPTFETRLDVPKFTSGVYDLTAGIFLVGHGERGYTKSLMHLILPSSDGPAEMAFFNWSRTEIDQCRIVDIGMAIQEHDLLLVVTVPESVPSNLSALYSV